MLRYKKNLLWMVILLVLTSAFWAMKVEITYRRNVQHIPTDFRLHGHNPPYLWKA